MKELGTRVKFESNDVIRFLTADNRDIMFRLDKDGKTVHFLSEVQVENNYFDNPKLVEINLFNEVIDGRSHKIAAGKD